MLVTWQSPITQVMASQRRRTNDRTKNYHKLELAISNEQLVIVTFNKVLAENEQIGLIADRIKVRLANVYLTYQIQATTIKPESKP